MGWTAAQLESLRKAAASGATSVRDADGKTVTFRSLDEMFRLIATLENATASRPRRSVSYVRPMISRPRSGG